MEYFTFRSYSPGKNLKEISTPLSVACGGGCCSIHSHPVHHCNAIWDTGATSSMISRRIARELQLHSTGEVEISGVHGVNSANTYIVDLIFACGFMIPGLRVSEADDGGGFDVLIGMDVISRGRLTVDGLGEGCHITFAFPAGGAETI